MQKDQELIRLRRINQQNEDEREQLQRNVSLAMTGKFSRFQRVDRQLDLLGYLV